MNDRIIIDDSLNLKGWYLLTMRCLFLKGPYCYSRIDFVITVIAKTNFQSFDYISFDVHMNGKVSVIKYV